EGRLMLLGESVITFNEKRHLIFNKRETLPYHSNGMRFTAYGDGDEVLRQKIYYSVGGGFVVNEEAAGADRIKEDDTPLPYHFLSGDALLQMCRDNNASVSELMLSNERSWRSDTEIRDGLLRIWR